MRILSGPTVAARIRDRRRRLPTWKPPAESIPLYVGLAIIAAVAIVALLAPALAPHDPFRIDALNGYRAPDRVNLLGTDSLGRDVLSRIIYGARISLAVGLSVSILAGIVGTAVGLVAAMTRADEPLMRVLDGLMAFPAILLAIALVAALGASVTNVIVALTLVQTPRMARLVRAAVLSIRSTQYVEAAHATGCRLRRIMVAHILPNSVAPIIVQTTFFFASAMQTEAALSFLGVGTPTEIPSWGNMLAEARQALRTAPWASIYPGLVITVTVLALNLLGDQLRDRLDPRLRLSRAATGK